LDITSLFQLLIKYQDLYIEEVLLKYELLPV